MNCLACGEPLPVTLERAGSLRCINCRGTNAALDRRLVTESELFARILLQKPLAAGELTRAELGVLRASALGHSARSTADLLGKSHHTVISQRRKVLWKLGAKNMAHAVALAGKAGLLW